MSIGYSRKKGIRSAAVFFLAAFLLLSMMSPAWADDTYYATWADFQKSGNPAQTWNDVTNAMDAVLDTARQKFKDGDFDGAYDCVNDAYYGYYETTGFERIAMGYISGARKSEMELQFSACKAVCKDKGSEDDFNKEADKLSSMLHEDANVLDGTSGDSGSSDEDKETLATRLFADKYYANYTEYQKAAEAEGLTKITWNDVVDAMTEVIRTAKQKYADGDAEGAYDCINDGYYGYYEITGFERIAMGYISGSRKSEMELQFSSCKSVTKEGGSTDVFDAECDKLVDMLRHDAHVLECDVSALENDLGYGVGDWVPYLTVDYKVTGSDDQVAAEGTFMEMSASDGPHYGANVKLDKADTYKVEFTFHSPAENGYLIHSDAETGPGGLLEDHFKDGNLTVTYEGWDYTPQEW